MKVWSLLLMLFLSFASRAQNQSFDAERLQRWKELNLTQIQKERIAALIRRQKIQERIDWMELNKILTEEQKKKIKGWRETKKHNRKKQF